MSAVVLSDEARSHNITFLHKGDGKWTMHIPSHCHLKEPIRISVEESPVNLSIDVEEGACVTFVEIMENRWTSYAVHMAVGRMARVRFFSLNGAGGGTVEHKSILAHDAHVYWCNLTLACGEVEQTLVSTLKGDRAKSTIDWAFYGKDSDRYILCARNIFEARDGGGEVTLRGVAEGKAHLQCRGAIDIESGGSGTDTHLTEDMLVLDPTAKVDAVPALEIRTNDVKASHSATVSRVTPEELFYFGARGIAEQDARCMYIDGFLKSVCERHANPVWMKLVADSLQKKYHSSSLR